VVLALIVALLLGLGAVAIAEAADRRIRHPDEVGEFAGLPLLSAIPDSSFSLDDESAASIESFVTLRSSLTYFNVDQGLSSVLVTSPGKEDGKTTVSIKLARALARAGRDVILIDADLRRPAIAKRLGFPSSVGLGQVLAGDFTLDQVISDEAAPAGGRLRVLTAGRPVPTPSELLGSRRMLELMSKLSERCDIVIIDSTPLLTVSDSMPLLRAVSGVVLVARVNRTSREAIARLRTVVDSAGGKPLGVVTTGTRRGGLYVAPGYGYESAYTSGPGVAANGNGMPGRRSRWRPWAGRGDAKRVGVSEDE
jgi:capsular exopolysaccharide synthesis family protein